MAPAGPVAGPLAHHLLASPLFIAMPSPQQSDFQQASQTLRQRLRRLPVVGPVLNWVSSIVHIRAIHARTAEELKHLSVVQEAHLQHFTKRIDRYDALGIENRFVIFDSQILSAEHQLQDARNQIGMLESQQRALEGQLHALDAQVGQRLQQLDMRLAQVEATVAAFPSTIIPTVLPTIRSGNAELENRIAALIREVRLFEQFAMQNAAQASPPAVASPQVDSAANEASAFDMESFYVAFEDKFRGTHDDIQNRLRVYLPYVTAFAGQADARVVDIGCGRGEWLDLLRQQGIAATGVDLNHAMVKVCQDMGLQAECDDAIAWLRRQREGSLAAVTGFHIIEHLPFGTMVALFDAALRALRPDGLIIFETPNPENVIVGSCNFYYDPTHQHPLVPTVIEFLARQRGFAHAEILRLHPFAEDQRIHEDTDLARRLNHLFYGPQDFAILGWKNHALPAARAETAESMQTAALPEPAQPAALPSTTPAA
ncbi:class I SAM-dependent methyltransferase [Noviherbaspirillum saxi]|uniref:Methyltransferase domain-containing protein n=1 Tax=Noviherbaspirillum saxi TaxID=2320863 RepID=A0A3A3FVL0_9BURK|nr:class I SAM-dependent methyltransferase [Noviherbaspirillum saxi]RJF99364.1 methyltransferase domain-containing protein [Noviherbaspirillum saxi]